VDNYCQRNNIPILMRIPFDREIASLYSQGVPLVTARKEYVENFMDMFQGIEREMLLKP
jgi:MinD superfamily P-loop ATPase